jgi:ribonuclease J
MTHCHTSGHAPVADLQRLAKALAPKMLVPIHSFHPEEFAALFGQVHVKEDGIWWNLG